MHLSKEKGRNQELHIGIQFVHEKPKLRTRHRLTLPSNFRFQEYKPKKAAKTAEEEEEEAEPPKKKLKTSSTSTTVFEPTTTVTTTATPAPATAAPAPATSQTAVTATPKGDSLFRASSIAVEKMFKGITTFN